MTDTILLKDKLRPYKLEYVARKLKISRETLSKKISGASEFKQKEIVALSELLKLSPEEKEAIFFASKGGK